ncbi:MAG TPA: LPS assembly protein LptD [Acetobacteraceae bacterium]|nr:LPS assembly protein LptD [Acetobacteraceae bacterium]
MKKRALALGLTATGAALAGAALLDVPQARAQMEGLVAGPSRPISRTAPVTFLADQVSYDKTTGIVTATGHVQAWQNGHVLEADKVVIDRVHNTAVASGHVVLMEPGGQVVFAKQARLSSGMKNAVMHGVATILAENGRMVANGARRYGGVVNELSKVIYSTCNLCKRNPEAAPLWQIRARSAVEDLKRKVIEYRDAEVQVYGFPVFWTPYISQPDPSVKRMSGFLIPSFGSSTHIGAFLAVPYFWDINKSSDATIVPIIATKMGPVLDVKYRKDFNDGRLNVNISGGRDRGRFADAIFSNGTFDLNNTWRAGFTYNRTSNVNFLNDFRYLPNAAFLSSNAYLEGFGAGSYARVDAQLYQGLVASINQNQLPIVTPYARYDYFGEPDRFGGRLSFAASAFNVFRSEGTNSRRVAAVTNYELPLNGPLGSLWTARFRLIAAGYQATKLNEQPNFSPLSSASTARAVPIGAIAMRLPLVRSAGDWGEQIIEPRVQLVAAPNYGITQNNTIPNEDSLDPELTDANLFSLNRFYGIDRIAGGSRIDYAMQGDWYLPSGALANGLIGQSYSFHKNDLFPTGSGLSDKASDIVARASLSPNQWLNLTYRTRLSHVNFGVKMIDGTVSVGTNRLRFTGGYLYSSNNPYYLYLQSGSPPAAYYTPRREITGGISTTLWKGWSVSAAAQRNLATGQFDNAALSATWQNECTAINFNFYRRFTSFNYDTGSTTFLINITLKTLGNIGFNAL